MSQTSSHGTQPLRCLVLCFGLIIANANTSQALNADDPELAQRQQKWQKHFEDQIQPILKRKCLECHQGDNPDGEFDLARFTTGKHALEKLDVWDRVGRRVRLKEMPPEGSPQLTDPEKALVHRWLDSTPRPDECNKLATDETQSWYRGVVMSRRMTQTEYRNAIRELTFLPFPDHLPLPPDGAGGEGFDTNGDSLFTSPLHIEQYLKIASHVVDQLLSDASADSIQKPIEIAAAQSLFFKTAGLVAAEALPKLHTIADDQQTSCRELAARVISQLVRRAFRRPVSESEQNRLMQLYDQSIATGATPAQSLAMPLQAVLISPRFLFVVESQSGPGGIQRLTQHQLATRLALFLWSAPPDEWLLALADREELQTEAQIKATARTMLKDDRAITLGSNFGLQWLGLTNFETTAHPDADIFPQFDSQLASDLKQEVTLTLASIFQEDRSVREFIQSDRVWVNQRLAHYYGLPVPKSSEWTTTSVRKSHRGGLLTMGATLIATSYPRRTSPVLRGHWVLEKLLGDRVPPPPPGVPELSEQDTKESASLRERLEAHRADPNCASCHNRMDPLGFGLEVFDGMGRYRRTENGQTIDATGRLPNGQSFQGPEELKQILLSRSEEFERHLARKLLGFALGRELNKFDDCVIDDAVEALQSNDSRASALIDVIVTSYPFQHRFFRSE